MAAEVVDILVVAVIMPAPGITVAAGTTAVPGITAVAGDAATDTVADTAGAAVMVGGDTPTMAMVWAWESDWALATVCRPAMDTLWLSGYVYGYPRMATMDTTRLRHHTGHVLSSQRLLRRNKANAAAVACSLDHRRSSKGSSTWLHEESLKGETVETIRARFMLATPPWISAERLITVITGRHCLQQASTTSRRHVEAGMHHYQKRAMNVVVAITPSCTETQDYTNQLRASKGDEAGGRRQRDS